MARKINKVKKEDASPETLPIDLLRGICYALVEVLGSQAIINLVQNKVVDPYIYAVVIAVIIAIRTVLKKYVDHPVVRAL